MKRRTALRMAGVALAAVALVPSSTAQPPGRTRRIAFLSAFPRKDVEASYAATRAELERLGWSQGLDYLEVQTSEGVSDRLPALAANVVQSAPDVILVSSAPATRALMQATATIPIVMIGVGDPVAYGIVKSYAEPGGNVTGTSYLVNESSRKAIELLKEIAPRIASVALFVNPTNEAAAPGLKDLRVTAQALGVRIHPLEVTTPADFAPAFDAIRRERTDSILLWPEALVRTQRMAIGRFAAEHRLPVAIVGGLALLDARPLFTYGPSSRLYPALVARYVDRILRGASPARLAIEQPSKFELGFDLATAAALGLTIPAPLLARADQVIR